MRRSYSICVPARSGELAVGVRHLPGGRFSGFVADGLRAGTCSTCCRPRAASARRSTPGVGRHHAFVAAGSGITPVISIVATVLAEEPRQPLHRAVYGNRRTDSIMFLEELEDLKNRYPSRLQIVHVLSRESAAGAAPGGAPGRRAGSVRCSTRCCRRTRSTSGTSAGRSGWCRTPGRSCASAASPRSTSTASCSTPTPPRSPRRLPRSPATGRDGHDRARRPPLDVPGRRRLDPRGCAAQPARRALRVQGRRLRDVPVPARGGRGGDGPPYALEEDEVDAGVVLACQAHPRSERIVLDFDAR